MKKILLLIPLFFLATGCWNYRELNKLAIATAIAVDKDDNGYEVSILIANGKNAQTSPKEGQSQNVVYSGKGPTISRALRQIELLIPKQIYIGHLGVVVISDKVAKDGLKNTLDFFVRNPESVKRFYIILSKDDKAKDVIKTLSPLESFPGQSIASNISISNESQAISTSITYSKFIENYLKKGKEPVLPTITIIGKEKEGEKNKILETSSPKAKTKLDKLGIFKKDKLLGYISKNESRGINILSNQVDNMILSYKCGSGNIVTDLTQMETTMKSSLKNNKPVINIKITADGAIREITCNKDIENGKVITKIEKKTEKKVKKQVEEAISTIQKKYKSDIFGFGNLFYKKYPKYFNENQKNWNDKVFPKIKVNVDVDISLLSKGSVENSIKGE